MEDAGITFGAVFTVSEASEDAQSMAVGALMPFADGKGMTVAAPFHIEGEAKVAPLRAPAVGQHNEEVLKGAGYATDEIAQLKGLGVLG